MKNESLKLGKVKELQLLLSEYLEKTEAKTEAEKDRERDYIIWLEDSIVNHFTLQ
jgi:hypothetical protein